MVRRLQSRAVLRLLSRVSFLALGLSFFGCGPADGVLPTAPSEESGGPPSSNRVDPSGEGRVPEGTKSTDDAGVPLPPCDASETAALQKSFDAAHPADTDAVLVVRTACGPRFFTGGPSKYPATTLHRIASNTKMYVASLVLLLAEDGLVGLDAPASQWVEGVPGGDAI